MLIPFQTGQVRLFGASINRLNVAQRQKLGLRYVTDDRLYCVYIAPTPDLIKEHAARGGFPCDRITEVRGMMDPTTAEGQS